MTATVLLQSYAHRIRELRRANANVPETALAPAFQQLLEGLLPLVSITPGLIVVPEYLNPGVGRPDIALVRQGAPPRAFVELKAPNKPADPRRWRAQDQRQFERFKELRCWGTSNFTEFRLLHRADELGSAVVVPERALRPDQNDIRANRAIAEHDTMPFQRLIEMLGTGAGQEPAARDARHLATLMAHSARLAIIGNPPYRRLEEGENRTLVGDWLDQLWDDLKEPVRNAGQGGQLNTFPELSVAFWRWAIWKLFEAENAPRRGIVAFISNRKFLTGWPYAGLRKMMRERFDRIEIIDLRGDIRRGERAGVDTDEGVFNIMVGTAITMAIADGSKADGEPADIYYQDSWTEGLFSRRAKFDWLVRRAEAGAESNAVMVVRDLLDDMRPTPFLNGDLISLPECFKFYRSGLQTKRDDLVYDASIVQLNERIRTFLSASDNDAREMFHDTRDRKWVSARAVPFDTRHIRRIAYRPFDRRHLYNQRAYGDFLRPVLQNVWGDNNVGLYALPNGTGAGPAVWCHALLPDYHAFRGSYGGYAFPLYDRRPNINSTNISPGLVESLSTAYGQLVAAGDVFDAILCLLSASSYTRRFAEDLEDVFPHVPFPARHEVFQDAVTVGRQIRAVETFERPPTDVYLRHDFVSIATEPRGTVVAVEYADGAITLGDNYSGRITGLPESVWTFSVSGYRLVPRWLEARIGLPAELTLVRELRDICGRIAELIDLFAQGDIVLETTLQQTLTREAHGLAPLEQEANDERD